MVSQARTSPARGSRPWWWPLAAVALAAGVVVGLVVGLFTSSETGSVSTAVVNTRPAASLPNDRLDLINDLSTAMTLGPVLDPVAREHGLASTTLGDDVAVTRIGSSTFARVTYDGPGDDVTGTAILSELITSAEDYLAPPAATGSQSPAVRAAALAQQQAVTAYYTAIRTNGGIDPQTELTRLQAKLATASGAGQGRTLKALRAKLPRVINKARKFALLDGARTQAATALDSLVSQQATDSVGGPQALVVTPLDAADSGTGLTSSVSLRRGLAAGVAAALVVGGFLLALTLARRRRA